MKHIKLFIFPLVLLGIIFFSSCSKFERASVSVDKILSQSPDEVFELENLFEDKKIIFVGSNDHNLINDVEFFDKKNLTKFYNKGLRYILFEGDVPTVEDDMLNNQVMIFYPWESVGVQYCENPILKNIAEINQNFIDSERI